MSISQLFSAPHMGKILYKIKVKLLLFLSLNKGHFNFDRINGHYGLILVCKDSTT